ncbi:hypothetical protein BOTBODRAFT_35338 [Botryobasidium botryosum FD-172 SS1]|uniref:CN hydrolase domain-containing protein n=1 Tax=Botryobasidium botryosum (strain FD-172 SS1) TaxID=930990 RepID=A0A067MIS4_BOTB1|nr:hypothetical protein BOTBODRAFT_35338 [Botryobasidium botryosum FD-172 SS1]
MRVGIVQFAPKVEHVQENIEKARKFTDAITPGSVDLLCFPETIFTGYVFPTAESIKPYLELPGSGPTSLFCSDLAKRLRCFVSAGYPERLSGSDTEETQGRVAKNSAVLYGPDGELVGNYQKSNLFDQEVHWALPGPGLSHFSVPSPIDSLSIAICMDLNPWPPSDWRGTDEPYELASYCIKHKVKVLVLLCAWLDSERLTELESDTGTANYWMSRLRPLWQSGAQATDGADRDDIERTVIICNRTGTERGVTFAGTSLVAKTSAAKGVPEIVTVMGRKEEGLRLVDV